MKKIVVFAAVYLFIFSCHNKVSVTEAGESSVKTDTAANVPVVPDAKPNVADGLWTGVFSLSQADSSLQAAATDFKDKYDKKLEAKYKDEEEEGFPITDINEIPLALRKAYYIEPLNGYYALRSPNKISVIIDAMNDAGEISGRSVCAGDERILRGTYIKSADGFTAELKEPGDDKNDGVFKLSFSPASGKASGTWTSQAKETKTVALEKKDFAYDPEAGDINYFRPKNKTDDFLEFKKNPSKDLLATKDVENLTKPELTILRNLIYARHGYTFASVSFRNYFEDQDWYVPFKQDIRNDLTDIEKKNADKIKSFEKYAANAYDEFGR